MRFWFTISLFILLISGSVAANNNPQFLTGNTSTLKVNPTNWWIGMEMDTIQLLIYDKTHEISPALIKIEYKGIETLAKHTFPNKKYIALDIVIHEYATPGNVPILIGKQVYQWKLGIKNKAGNGRTYAQGLTSADFMYLLMPDRFANGDYSNDRIPGMRDQSLRRDTVFNRHGGDLQGVIDHLDYLRSLGVTALWLNPVLENDMPTRTEHGYAITDHYQVDPRLGGNEKYVELVKAAHRSGMKIIQDAIYNHVGLYHWFIQDMPSPDWVHQWPEYQNTSFKDQTLFDPHAAPEDRKIMSDGWFTKEMPDLNQENPFVSHFLIQHALWCVEEFGIDGWRVDTYAYNDLDFMNTLNAALLKEYPAIFMFGETWVHGVSNQAYFTRNNFNIPYKSNLPGVTDFQTYWGITDAMTRPFGWTEGVNVLYSNLARDFMYQNPMNNVIFLGNHDLSRSYSVYGETLEKMKSALCWLLTSRGIPQLYYGEEILMKGLTSPNDGYVRKDFPGGWKEDTINKFTKAGRTDEENEVWELIRTLANYRGSSQVLSKGNLTQYVPEDGVYVYFRAYKEESIMVIMNTTNTEKQVQLSRFSTMVKGRRLINLLNNTQVDGDSVTLKPWQTLVIRCE